MAGTTALLVALVLQGGRAGANIKMKLAKDLFSKYPESEQLGEFPIQDATKVHIVSLELELYQLIDMDLRLQTMNTISNLVMEWQDDFLMWNPEDYSNFSVIHVPWDKIWIPDITLYNPAGDGDSGKNIRFTAQVEHTGRVTLMTSTFLHSRCMMHMVHWPFDIQTCHYTFGSWARDISQLDIKIRQPNATKSLANLHPNGLYVVLKATVEKHRVWDPCCPGSTFAALEYRFQIVRDHTYYYSYFIAPAIMVTILASCAFLLPVASGEKVTVSMSAMLTMMVFFSIVMQIVPQTGEIPLISKYLALLLVQTFLSTVLGVFSIKVHHFGDSGHVVPNWIWRVANFVGRVTNKNCDHCEKESWTADKQWYHVAEVMDAFHMRLMLVFLMVSTAWMLYSQPDHETHDIGAVNGSMWKYRY